MLIGIAVALLASALAAVPASAGETRIPLGFFCEPTGVGPAPGCEPTFSSPHSLAVHQTSGDVVVLDVGTSTIRRFKPNGEPDPFSALGTNTIDGMGSGPPCTPPSVECDGTPENGFTFVTFLQGAQIAVDSSGGPTDGNIYLTQRDAFGLHLVDVFAPTGEYIGQLTGTKEGLFGPESRPVGVTVDPDGNVFVSDFLEKKIYKYTPSGQPPVNGDGEVLFCFSAEGSGGCSAEGPSDPGRLAAGAGASAGDLFASNRVGSVFKLGAGGEVQCEVQGGETSAVAVDPTSGHVLIANQKSEQTRISEYDASECSEKARASLVASFDSKVRADLAVGPSGQVYLTGRDELTEQSIIELFSPLVPLPEPVSGEASSIGETTATLHGTIEANGEELTDCSFEYGPTSAYGSSAPCEESPAEIGTGGASVHADISGLAGETVYHYRLVAANANGAAIPQGADRSFQTVGKPQIQAVWTEGVANTEATLKARINPQSATTTYLFEWGLGSAPYEHTTEEATIDPEPVPHTVSAHLSGLAAGTTYHYRVIAFNNCHPESAPAAVCTSEATDHAFRTHLPGKVDTDCANQAFRYGISAFLPDCRAYEMVSPVDKNGGNIITELSNPSEPGGYIQAAPEGNRLTYTSTAAFAGLPATFRFNQYMAERHERGEAGEGWSSRGINPPVVGQEVAPGDDIFGLFRYVHAFTPDLCSAWWIDYQTPPLGEDAQEGYPNLYRRDNCGAGEGELETLTNVPPPVGTVSGYVDKHSIKGVSADGRHTIFATVAKLTPEALENANDEKLYDHFGGAPHLVSVLPNGSPAPGDSVLGSGDNLAGAVSTDGTRVYWTGGSIYLREHPEQGIVAEECSAPGVACTVAVSPGGGTFWAASEDGSKAIYTKGGTLYEFDLGREEAGEEGSLAIATGVSGVAGASEDVERVYFVSTQALPDSGANSEGDEAQAGEPNLYLYEAGGEPEVAFVARLVAGDVGVKEPGERIAYNLVSDEPFERATRVSPDGGRIAFNSRAQLTDYENASAADDRAAVEVYTYQAGGALACASCKPSGARPETQEMFYPYEAPWESTRMIAPNKVLAAAWLPTWEHPLQASNALSADGKRLFFNANDALLPRDVNDAQDVYEWEALGAGGCDSGDPDYFPQNGGCLYLISGGESSYESQFWEASPDGSNVFFTTAASLLPQDPGSVDLYDARVGGGFAQPGETAPCEGEACQSPPSPPPFATPASSSYNGPPNPPHRGKKHCPKGKHRVRRGGKSRCVKNGKGKGKQRRGRAGAGRRAAR